MDEVGFGGKPYRNYGYSKIGEACVMIKSKAHNKNISSTVIISQKKVEFVKFFLRGTTLAYYCDVWK